jgi:3'(2'), 5'-bisphosphate nucleotidase
MHVTDLWNELERTLKPIVDHYRSRLRVMDVTEKPDRSLLSEADIAIQEHLIASILAVDPSAKIIAEERSALASQHDGRKSAAEQLWIIDPLDGTSEFVRPDHYEYCIVVCLLKGLRPVAAFVLAPEIGPARSTVCIRVAGEGQPIQVNERVARDVPPVGLKRASVTRSATSSPRPFERHLLGQGYELKTRTTSQTLDMVRTCVDLAGWTEPPLASFGLFYREDQKVWDGAAGICLARAAGLRVTNGRGHSWSTISIPLDEAEPRFDSTLVAPAVVADQVLVALARQ